MYPEYINNSYDSAITRQTTQLINGKRSEKTFLYNTQMDNKHKGKEQEKKKGTERNNKNSQETINKMAIIPYLSIITLNINGLNSPIKRHTVTEWI